MCFAISPTHHAFTEVHSRLGDDFDSGFLQIPHWLNNMFTSAAAASHLVSSDTLAFVYTFPPLWVVIELTSTSYYPCRAHKAFS